MMWIAIGAILGVFAILAISAILTVVELLLGALLIWLGQLTVK